MKALRPGDDPDLDQAIENLRPVADALRSARARLVKVDRVERAKEYGALRAEVRQHQADIAAAAQRIVMDAAQLTLIVETESRLRARGGRRPSYADLARAIEIASVVDADRARETQLAARDAQAVAVNAARISVASAAAAQRLSGAAV